MDSLLIFAIVFIFLRFIFSIMVIVLNGLFLTALVKKRSLHTPSNAVLGGLCCSDLLIGIVSCILLVLPVTGMNGNTFSVIDIVTYKIYLLLITLSCLFMILVNLDRYAAICHPFKYLNYATTKLCVTISISSSLLCSSVVIVLLVTDIIFKLYSTAVVFIIMFCVLMIILVTCNWRIFRVIHRHRREISSIRRNIDLHCGRFESETKRYRIIALLIIIFVVCKLPPCISFVLFATWNGQITTSLVIFSFISEVLTSINSFLNPLVYCCNIRSFRDAIKEILCCRRQT